MKTRPNDKCPCGSAKKFKRCCGSVIGQIRYIVVNPETNDALENDAGLVMVFEDKALACMVGRRLGWSACGEIVTLSEPRFERFKQAVRHVIVTAKEFDVSEDDNPVEDGKPVEDVVREVAP